MVTTFFTAANRRYEYFAIPYAVSVLQCNPDAQVEICLEDPDSFAVQNAKAIRIVSKSFPDRLLFRGGEFDGRTVNSVRFIERPQLTGEYTYIGDIDIVVLEHVSPQHLHHMRGTGLPFSNILRPDGLRLSGLHFTRTDAYYPVDLSGLDLRMGDEALLFHLAKKGGLPSPEDTWRPVHGIHLSPNRRPFGVAGEPDWGLRHVHFLEAFLQLRDGDLWQEIQRFFDPRFLSILLLLQVAIDGRQPEFLPRSSPDRDLIPHLKRLHDALSSPDTKVSALEAKTAAQEQALEELRASRDEWQRRARKAKRRANRVSGARTRFLRASWKRMFGTP